MITTLYVNREMITTLYVNKNKGLLFILQGKRKRDTTKSTKKSLIPSYCRRESEITVLHERIPKICRY